MMRIDLHIGLPHAGGAAAAMLAAAAARLQAAGVGLVLSGPQPSALFLAVQAAEGPLADRFRRDLAGAQAQAAMLARVRSELTAAAAAGRERVIVSSPWLAWCDARALARLRDLLAPHGRVHALAQGAAPSWLWLRDHARQVLEEGRATGAEVEAALAARLGAGPGGTGSDGGSGWWAAAQADPAALMTGPAPWLDLDGLQAGWDAALGPGCLRILPGDVPAERQAADLCAALDLPPRLLRAADAPPPPALPAAPWVARAQAVNHGLQRLAAGGRVIPLRLWRRLLGELQVDGPPADPAPLRWMDGGPAGTIAVPPGADPGAGFRATQYLAAFLPLIDRATAEAAQGRARAAGVAETPLSPSAAALMPETARANLAALAGSRYAPHNSIGTVEETAALPAFAAVADRAPGPTADAPTAEAPMAEPPAGGGTLVVACMKNEAPYILEWIAHHRAIGVTDFLIYTNGCEDGTTALLDRLMALGLVEHRDNNDWKGKSPQQAALNKALREPVLQRAGWIAHIDVDEFMNIRCGNGTLADLYARIGTASNVAMTWRLFGHNGIDAMEDRPVIAQFDRCAPKYAPKPHTVWGFKSLMRNIGAYAKLSCHRPNQLDETRRAEVRWVNGSGADMGEQIKTQGWRSSTDSIGYDLIQLNHYALRSTESFLVKRQRGRALHVDRSIGLNYWVRMDWNYHTDRTILRNLPRVEEGMARLRADPELDRLHRAGVAWHRAKTAELHATPEFETLYRQAVGLELTELERVAYALSLDLES